MKAEQVKAKADQALEQLTQSLSEGKSETMLNYLRAMGRFHKYSFTNACLIFSQFEQATHVAGFGTWKNLGRSVKKGEKGIGIIAPLVRNEEDSQGDKNVVKGFRCVHVFDISQTKGEPLPETAQVTGDPLHFMHRIKEFAAQRDIEVQYATSVELGSADGASCGGKNIIRSGLEPAEEFSVLAHELGHELLHRKADENRPDSKTVRETEAEAVAFVVCDAIGLNTSTAASDYIQLYQGDKETLLASMDRVRNAANTILESVLEKEHELDRWGKEKQRHEQSAQKYLESLTQERVKVHKVEHER